MAGGPSHVDTFDPKPQLDKLHGKDVPESIARHVPKIKRAGLHNIMGSPWKFKKRGACGMPVSDLFPAVARQVDDLCLIRTMQHRSPVHGPAEVVALTGTQFGDRPGLGSWFMYGLGSENQNLPGFVVMNLHTAGMQFPQSPGWTTAFLPSRYQGTVINPQKGIDDIGLPKGMDRAARRRQLDLLYKLNHRHSDRIAGYSELEARIQSYEMAFRMQMSAPELFELHKESEATEQMYGMDDKESQPTGRACLLARRMVERGVRVVQIRVGGWDAHGNIKGNHSRMARRTDQPVAGLLADLKQRGLLDQTLVVWGGEFGRTPTMEGLGKGRDHSPSAYSIWMAGGGVKGGQIVGETDPIGYVPISTPVRPSDLHATMLHAFGLDQYKLTYMHNGRAELPTVLGGDVVHDVFS